jgi:hypothetical protein
VKSVKWKMLGVMAYIETAYKMCTSSHCKLCGHVLVVNVMSDSQKYF